MHPVLAPSAIQIAELNRRQLLADAERRRLIRTATNGADERPRSAATLRRLRDGLVGTIAAVARPRRLRSAPVGHKAAAIRSA